MISSVKDERMQELCSRLLVCMLISGGLILQVIFFYKVYQHIPCNSDLANMILEADQIINGNIFLKGWNFPGITFLTTDLLYYIVSTFLFGINVRSYFLANALMMTSLISCGMLLIGRKNIITYIMFLLLAAPTTFMLTVSTGHTAMFTFSLISIYLITKAMKAPQKATKKYYFWVMFFLIMACIRKNLGRKLY